MNPNLLSYAVLCTALYLGLGLMPFAPTEIRWGEALGWFPDRLLTGGLSALLLALPLGFFWQGAVWPRLASRQFAVTIALFLAAGLLAGFLLLGQIYFPPRLSDPGGLLLPWSGFAAGMALWWLLGPKLSRLETPHWLWPALVLCTAVSTLLPLNLDAPLNAPTQAGSTYFDDLPQRIYLLIKSAILWLPVGFLYTLAGSRGALPRWGIALVVAWLLEGLPWLGTQPLSASLDLLFALPGLWAGAWLGERSLMPARSGAPRPAMYLDAPQARASIPTPHASTQGGGTRVEPPPAMAKPTGRRHRSAPAVRHLQNPLRWLVGLSLLLASAVGVADFPMWQLGLGLISYVAALWVWPLAWLVVVPIALPLLDLAPWTGRYFLDEFDLLMLATAGTLFLRGRNWPGMTFLELPKAWLALFGISLLISLALGLGSPPPLDANAFSSYWSPYNSLRVAKGYAWGSLLYMLLRLTRPDPKQLADRLAAGMGLGLLGVGLVGLWEHWLFSGAGDYRIVSTFSSMHIGGGHIEAYLAASLPFLWLSMSNQRRLILIIPAMVLTGYVTIFTVARGGVLAMGLVLLLLAVASLRLVWHRRIQAVLPIGVLAVLGLGLLAGIGGGYFQQRLEHSGDDWQIRVYHWKQAMAMMDATPMAQFFGMGLGSFPRIYLERGPAEPQSATFGFVVDKNRTFLRLGSGDTLYYAQRVAVQAGKNYHLSLSVRSRQANGRIETPVCEKQLLNSRHCIWMDFAIPGDGQWHLLSRDFSSGVVGVEEGLQRPPVELSLYDPGKAGRIDVGEVRLLDPKGVNLIGNGDFSHGADDWFFSTHSHLPWHIKNVWVHVLFEQGWVGLLLFTGLIATALVRLARAAWHGNRLAWTLLASLTGMLTVGTFDSLLDTPRLATLLIGFSLLGAGHDWRGSPSTGNSRRKAMDFSAASNS